MILINFAHPLTPEHIAQIEALAGQKIERVVEVHTQIDPQQPLAPQVTALADQAKLTPLEWQSAPLLVNPPSLNFVAVVLLVELHGRCGYFPAMVRTRPVPGAVPPRYEVAEIVNLQTLRDEARKRRCLSSNT